MERFPGKHRNTFVYYRGGYTYHCDKRPNSGIYRCSTKSSTGCLGKIQVVEGVPIIREAHNMHDANLRLLDELRFKQEVLRRCRETLQSFNEIFREVSVLYPEGAVNVTYISLHNSMDRARRGARPPVPESLNAFSRVLQDYEPVESFYRGCAESTDGHSTLVFADREMIERLNGANEIFVDGTFRVVPNRPRACQLFVIYIRHMGVGFPVVFGLCERRTRPVYEAVFRFILNLAPGLAQRLQSVVSDFERAIIAAVRIVFPEARPKGCWFHFCQAVFKKWRSLVPRIVPKEQLWMLMSMPLVPRERQDEALAIIAADVDRLAGQYPSMLQIMHYYRRQWVPLADVTTVGTMPVRTNNLCESFNRYICGRLGGKHPCIWTFLYKLHVLIAGLNVDWIRVERGERIRRGRRRRQLNDDLRLALYQKDLDAGRLGLAEFLRIAMLPRQRRAAEDADYMERAQENDPFPVELPIRDDFPPAIDNGQANGHARIRMEIPVRVQPAPIIPAEDHAGEIPHAENGNDDERARDGLELPAIPPLAPNFQDAREIGNVVILSSDDDENDDAPLLGIEVDRGRDRDPIEIEAPAPELPPLPPAPEPAREPPNIMPELIPIEQLEQALDAAAPNNNDEEEETENLRLVPCSICLWRRPNTLYLPCRHLVTCNTCSNRNLDFDATCQVCRRPIESRVLAFL